MTEFIFCRHGQTESNARRILQSWSDEPLNATGREQASEAGRALADQHWVLPIQYIFTSPIPRAEETARRIAEAFSGDIPVLHDPRLRECRFGSLEGLTCDEFEKTAGRPRTRMLPDYDFSPWNGEKRSRVLRRHLRVINQCAAFFPDRRIVIVGHGVGLGTVLDHLGHGERSFLRNGECRQIMYALPRAVHQKIEQA